MNFFNSAQVYAVYMVRFEGTCRVKVIARDDCFAVQKYTVAMLVKYFVCKTHSLQMLKREVFVDN